MGATTAEKAKQQEINLDFKIFNAEFTVNHEGKDLTFSYPDYMGTQKRVRSDIINAGLKPPTLAENASLLHAAFFNKKKGTDAFLSEQIKYITNVNLLSFTGILYAEEGIYIQDNPDIKKDSFDDPAMQKEELIQKLKSNDPSVRFVEYGFKEGEITPNELAENPYMVALAGEQGAFKLADVAAMIGLSDGARLYAHSFERNGRYFGRGRINYEFTKLSDLSIAQIGTANSLSFLGLKINRACYDKYASFGFAYGVKT